MSFRTSNDTIITNKVFDGANASETSESIDVTNQYLIAIQTSWSAGSTPSITVSMQASLDNVNWFAISSPTTTISGASGTNIIQLVDFAYKYIRVAVARASGSASVQVVFNAKGI